MSDQLACPRCTPDATGTLCDACAPEDLAQMTVGDMRELVGRVESVHRTVARNEQRLREIDAEPAMSVREIKLRVVRLDEWSNRVDKRLRELNSRAAEGSSRVERLTDTGSLLMLLRAHGVTRYRQGDLEIELGPGPKVSVPTPGCECPTCSSLWASPRWDPGPSDQKASDQRPPSPPLPDEQPAVEIDYEALARQEQERRQKRDGAGS